MPKLLISVSILHVLIIGNGAAGNSVALTIKRLNKGAKVTIVSDEPIPEYATCALPDYISNKIDRQNLFLKGIDDYCKEGVDVLLGKEAIEIDAKSKLVTLRDEELEYDKLVLATGSKPIIPRIEGVDKEGVFTFKTFGDADTIANHWGRRAVIIGAGPVGVEVAISLKKRGYEVFLIELMDQILPKRLDEKPSKILRKMLERHRIRVLTKERVTRILGHNYVEGVTTEGREIKCDTVVIAVGMRPNINLSKKAGVKIGELGGVVVDEHMATNLEDVYACGDCVEPVDIITQKRTLSLLWRNAVIQGRTAGFNCLGVHRYYDGSIDFNAIDVFGTSVVSIGHSLLSFPRPSELEIIESEHEDRYYRLIVCDERIVGAQSIGGGSEAGVIFASIWKRDSIKRIKRALDDRALLLSRSWYMNMKPYLWGKKLSPASR